MESESNRLPQLKRAGRTRRDHQIIVAMAHLPPEIIMEILSRLPVKSQLRFRCVCKPWLSLISDRQFIKLHLRMSTIDDNYSHHRFIFTDGELEFSFKSCSLNSMYSHMYGNALEFVSLAKEPLRYASIVGSCDGLLCIVCPDAIFLWNPSLREYKRLLHYFVTIRVAYSYSIILYGFGYDSSIDDFKVVALWRSHSHIDKYVHTDVNVYTLRTNSWRRIEDYPHGFPCYNHGIFVSGALHWISKDNDKHLSRIITAFDLATETYSVIAQPSYGDACHDPVLVDLGGGGRLCVIMNNNVRKHIDLWIMKEYGVGDSWTKFASFPYLRDPLNHQCYPYSSKMFLSKSGEVLSLLDSVINLYNSKDDTFRFVVMKEFHRYNCYESSMYIESLVSPNVERNHQ